MSAHPEPHSHLPPHPILIGCSRALALGALFMHETHTVHLFNIWQCVCFKAIFSNQATLSFSTESKYLFLFNIYLDMLENTLAFINSSHICGVSMFKAHTGEYEKVEWHSFYFLNRNCVKGVFSLRH